MLARNEYGETVRIPGKHPRKELLAELGYSHADKVYVDRKDGSTVHIGYVIGKRWWSFYEMVDL